MKVVQRLVELIIDVPVYQIEAEIVKVPTLYG